MIISDGPGKNFSSRLVKIDRPLFRIPTLGEYRTGVRTQQESAAD